MRLNPAVLGRIADAPSLHLLRRVGHQQLGRNGPGSIHRRAASVPRIAGMRSCTRMAAFASMMMTV